MRLSKHPCWLTVSPGDHPKCFGMLGHPQNISQGLQSLLLGNSHAGA